MKPLSELILDLQAENTKPKCQGRIYKCVINTYIDNRGNYTEKTTMVLQKRASCRCCYWEQDDITESTSCNKSPLIVKPENGKLYRLVMTNISHDWESGHIDGWDSEFHKL